MYKVTKRSVTDTITQHECKAIVTNVCFDIAKTVSAYDQTPNRGQTIVIIANNTVYLCNSNSNTCY